MLGAYLVLPVQLRGRIFALYGRYEKDAQIGVWVDGCSYGSVLYAGSWTEALSMDHRKRG